jgi:pseudaminic acid cytidylyltransferase
MKIAVIPARGGSKRIARKNIRPFAGRPLIGYAIDVARSAGVFDRIVVSTDDEEIAQFARARDADVPFIRPLALADDHTPTVPVIAHTVHWAQDAGWPVVEACCIYPGVPLLDPSDIVAAHAILLPDHYSFPVAPFPSAVQRALRRDPDGRTAPFDPAFVTTRTQDLEPAYHDAGQFYWADAQTWLAGKSIHGNATTIVIPAWRAVDIDTPEDWTRAESLYRAMHGEASR